MRQAPCRRPGRRNKARAASLDQTEVMAEHCKLSRLVVAFLEPGSGTVRVWINANYAGSCSDLMKVARTDSDLDVSPVHLHSQRDFGQILSRYLGSV